MYGRDYTGVVTWGKYVNDITQVLDNVYEVRLDISLCLSNIDLGTIK